MTLEGDNGGVVGPEDERLDERELDRLWEWLDREEVARDPNSWGPEDGDNGRRRGRGAAFRPVGVRWTNGGDIDANKDWSEDVG